MNKLIPGAWWLPILLGVVLWCWAADGAPVTKSKRPSLMEDFSKSLKLSKKLLNESRTLTHIYKIQKLPESYLDGAESDQTFPSISISISSWLKLQTADRLRLLKEALEVYPVYLEQLEKWEKNEEENEAPNFKDSVRTLRINLRDLLHHIKYQMTSLGIVPQPTPKQHNTPADDSDWCNRVRMYRALRSLERTLFRAVREYTALRIVSR